MGPGVFDFQDGISVLRVFYRFPKTITLYTRVPGIVPAHRRSIRANGVHNCLLITVQMQLPILDEDEIIIANLQLIARVMLKSLSIRTTCPKPSVQKLQRVEGASRISDRPIGQSLLLSGH